MNTSYIGQGGRVQYPLRDEGGLGRLKSILSATTSKFKDLEPNRELRAFPLMNRFWNFGRYTQSMTKLLQWTPSLEQEFQKKDDFHKGTIRVPVAWHTSKCLMTLAMRQTGGQPIVIKSPVLAKRVNRLETWLEKPRVKSG